MVEMNEGIIKYDRSNFKKTEPLKISEYEELESYRLHLHRTKLIGVYDNGLGYGNISLRKNYGQYEKSESPQFLISGTQTGHLLHLEGWHYTRVVNFSLEKFKISTVGPIEASSEALTHASLYQFNSEIQAIIHIHSSAIWKGMLKDHYPQTASSIPYGTKEMAMAIKECLENEKKNQGVIVMAGHEDGVVSYGPSLEIAAQLIFELLKKYGA